jgi:hypothetical protein
MEVVVRVREKRREGVEPAGPVAAVPGPGLPGLVVACGAL